MHATGSRRSGDRSDNRCHHFQWWFRVRIGTARGLGHIDSAPLKVVAPMKGCRSRVVPCSRCALVAAEGEARATGARVDSQNGCHHFQWWFRVRLGMTRGLGLFDSAPLKVRCQVMGDTYVTT